jgi:hypothetical protein
MEPGMQHHLFGAFQKLRHSQPTIHWAWTLLNFRDACGHVSVVEKGLNAAIKHLAMMFLISL